MAWTTADIPDQTGRVALVTGPTSGLGELTARVLAGRGARVLLGARDPDRTDATVRRIRRERADADLEHVPLDLAELGSVAGAAEQVGGRHPRLDLLIANAGVMATPARRTVDGFEWQLGVNHLGHQALIAALLDLLRATPASRVVLVSSLVHHRGDLDTDDPQWERRRYRRWQAYADSKLANLAYAFELQRRLAAADGETIAVAAHPGYSRTGLQTSGPTSGGGPVAAASRLSAALGNHLLAQPPQAGVLPQLHAATASEVAGGTYWGPTGPAGLRGPVGPARASRRARDPELGRWLWETSERLTGVTHPV